ncbi:hypothetical protein HAX54_041571 [Datura stramonium]|uniref:Secreted protein n=1 Tax=Datura stramonium TaxID=4076 RepID=A0ABS8SMG5_DATST|nr:hypothetical protein [Datura stramonium]
MVWVALGIVGASGAPVVFGQHRRKDGSQMARTRSPEAGEHEFVLVARVVVHGLSRGTHARAISTPCDFPSLLADE